jgi:hypothetical protein
MNTNHPVFERLTSTSTAFERHTVLHELDRRVHACPKALAQKVHAFVERGVPYFCPADAHYRAWAAEVARLWDSVSAA